MSKQKGKPCIAPTARYSIIQGSFWMSFCIIFAYVSVFLLSKGFSNSQIGIVVAVSGVISAFMQPIVADFADRSKKVSLRLIISFWAVVIIAVAAGLLIPGLRILLIAVFYGVAIAALQILTPLVNAIGMECINRGIPVNFGLARGIGSISYAVVSYLAGVLVAKYDTTVIPIMMILFYAILIIGILSFRFPDSSLADSQEKYAEPTIKTQKGKIKGKLQEKSSANSFYKRYTKFFVLLVGVTLSFISHNILNNYMFQIMQYHGGGSSEMGTALAIAATVELPTMLGFAFIVKRFSCGTLLKVSGTFFMIKTVLTLLAPNILGIYIAQGVQILGFALQVPASVYYVNQLMRPEDRVKGQAFMTVTNTLGSIAGSLLGGVLLDALGVRALLLSATVVALAGMLITYVSTEKHI